MKTSVFLSALYLLFAATLTQAQINIAMHNGNTSIAGMSSRPDGTVVKTSSQTWNNPGNNSGQGLVFNNFALLDQSGSSTSAKLTVNAGYSTFNNNGWGSGTDDHVMMEGWYGIRNTESFTVTDLPAGYASEFSVIIYGDVGGSRTMNYTIGATTKTITATGTFNGTFTEGENFVSFSGLTGTSFTVSGNPGASDSRSAINGMIIIPGTLPTPPEITSFTASDHYVTPGGNVTLNWNVSGADSLSIDQGIGNVTGTSTNVSVGATTTYTLTATNSDGSSSATVRVGAGPPRPNIVFFLVDDMGPQDTSVPFCLDGNGDPVSYNFNTFYQTPNMETLAANGMRFTAAYAQSVCSPTRSGLMTGRNSTRHAVSNWVGSGGAGSGGSPSNWRSSGLDATDVTLPQILQTGGYRTIHIGKAHFGSNSTGRDPLKIGFDVNIGGANFGHPGSYTGTYGQGGSHAVPHLSAYHNTGTFLTNALAQEANKTIESAHNNGVPFYLNMSFYAVHAPFTTNPDATGNYSGSHNSNHAKYATMLEGMDLAVGSIRQKLIDLGIAENTLIVFLGDNGSDSPAIPSEGLPNGVFNDYPLRGKKGSKYEGGTRVPFIACWAAPNPSNSFQQSTPIPANSIETDIVTSYDIPVTFLSAAGLTKPANFGEDGHDLLPYFRATPGTHRPQEFINHYPHNHRSDFFTSFRSDNWKLIYNYQSNSHQLYNLATDPTEQTNLAASDPETTSRLTRKLAQRLAETWGAPGPLIATIASSAPNGNVISIPNNSADVDGDGILDTNEDPNLNGIVDPGETDPDNDDTDGDNTKDGDEAKLGLDPLDTNSFFSLTPAKLAGGDLQITWPSALGSTFTIRSSTDLIDWSTVVASGVNADAGNQTVYNLGTPSGGKTFYRVELE